MSYNELLGQLAERWETTPEHLENLMNRIAYHESGMTMDPTIKQYSGGPGRGLFQFEEGKEQGGATAANRLIETLGETPDWLAPHVDASGRVMSIDASILTPEQQRMMFLGNYRQHPEASFKGVTEENLPEFWGKYHWAGDVPGSEKYNKKINSFIDTQNYLQTKEKTAEEKAFGF